MNWLASPLLACAVLACEAAPADSAAPASAANAATASVDTKGAKVAAAGAAVEIPAGAVAAAVQVGIAKVADPAAKLPPGASSAGSAFALTPHGTTFATPVTLKLPFAGSADKVLRLDDDKDTTWEVVEGATFAGGVATVKTSKFSVYIVVSSCQPLCAHAAKTCGTPATSASNGDCVSACTGVAAKPNSPCNPQRDALAACLLATNDASKFDCKGNLLPMGTACTAEQAAIDQCENPPSCPCFTAQDLKKAYDDAKAAGSKGVGAAGATTYDDWGGCFFGKEAGATFGSTTTVNSVIFTAYVTPATQPQTEAYFGWFAVGPLNGKVQCMVWQGDSKPLKYPKEVPATAVTAAEQSACTALLAQYKADSQHPAWTCSVQH